MAENDIAIQVGVQLDQGDLDNIKNQIDSLKGKKGDKISLELNKNITTEINQLKKDITEISGNSYEIKFHVDQSIVGDLQKIVDNLNEGLAKVGANAAQQVAQAAQEAAQKSASITKARTVQADIPSNVPIDKYTEELNKAIDRYQSVFLDDKSKLSSFRVMHDELNDSYTAAVQFNNALGETTSVMFRLQDIIGDNGESIGKEWVTSGQRFSASFKDAGKDIESTLDIVQKRINDLQTAYSKAFDKNSARTLFFEDSDIKNAKFAEPVLEQYNKVASLLGNMKFNAEDNGIAATKEQIRELTAEYERLLDVIREQRNARWTSTNFKETDTTSFVERYRNMLIELSNALKDDGMYDKFSAKISTLFSSLNDVKAGNTSTGEFLNDLRNIKQEISTFESSVKGKGIMDAFDISENQLARIKSIGKVLNAQENTDGIQKLKTQLQELADKYEELQNKMQAKGVSRERLNALGIDEKALDKELQTLSSTVANLGSEQWVSQQEAGIASMKAKFAEYQQELRNTIELTPELQAKLDSLAQTMGKDGAIDVTNWQVVNNQFKELQATISQFKESAKGMGSQLAMKIEAGPLKQVEDILNNLNSIDKQYSGSGVENLKQNLESLRVEYQSIVSQLQQGSLNQDQFDTLSKKVQQLGEQLQQAANMAKIFSGGIKNDADLKKFEQNAEGLRLKFEQLQNTYKNLIEKNPAIASKFTAIEDSLKNMDPTNIQQVAKDINNLSRECSTASGQAAGLRGALTDAFGGFGSYIARFTSGYFIITKLIQGVKSMVNEVKTVDSALIELQKVTDLTGASLDQFTEKAYRTGETLGRTGSDVLNAVTTFSRAGYDLQEATDLAKSALVMTNVGVDISSTEAAASDMISILKAFDIQVEDSMKVIDKLYNVANKEPLDFSNITQMLVTAGGTLAQTGTTLEETMALLTGGFATLRDTSVANG